MLLLTLLQLLLLNLSGPFPHLFLPLHILRGLAHLGNMLIEFQFLQLLLGLIYRVEPFGFLFLSNVVLDSFDYHCSEHFVIVLSLELIGKLYDGRPLLLRLELEIKAVLPINVILLVR